MPADKYVGSTIEVISHFFYGKEFCIVRRGSRNLKHLLSVKNSGEYQKRDRIHRIQKSVANAKSGINVRSKAKPASEGAGFNPRILFLSAVTQIFIAVS